MFQLILLLYDLYNTHRSSVNRIIQGLSRLNPQPKGFCWQGRQFESLAALGRKLLELLWRKETVQLPYYESILAEGLLSQYAAIAMPEDETIGEWAASIEELYKQEQDRGMAAEKCLYRMGYMLSGSKLLHVDNQQFRTVGELAGYLRERLAESVESFERLCHQLVDYDGSLDAQLEAWLIAIGKST